MNHVQVHYHHWADTAPVSQWDSEVIVVNHFIVNGHEIPALVAELVMEGPFMLLKVEIPEYMPQEYVAIWEERISEFRSHFERHQVSDDTDDDVAFLYVSRIEMIEIERHAEVEAPV